MIIKSRFLNVVLLFLAHNRIVLSLDPSLPLWSYTVRKKNIFLKCSILIVKFLKLQEYIVTNITLYLNNTKSLRRESRHKALVDEFVSTNKMFIANMCLWMFRSGDSAPVTQVTVCFVLIRIPFPARCPRTSAALSARICKKQFKFYYLSK